jgi:predicted DNA binding CopG/RHH family protein
MKKKKPGRPKLENGHKARLPSVRITQEQLANYRAAASKKGLTFADWIRQELDKSSRA